MLISIPGIDTSSSFFSIFGLNNFWNEIINQILIINDKNSKYLLPIESNYATTILPDL